MNCTKNCATFADCDHTCMSATSAPVNQADGQADGQADENDTLHVTFTHNEKTQPVPNICGIGRAAIEGHFRDVMNTTSLSTNKQERKDTPICSGVLDYFPAALVAVAQCSKAGNDQHNPGQPLHWARGKSLDHADCIIRHLTDRGTVDTDNIRHSAKVAWRALALLQQELEEAGAPLSRGSR